MGLEVAAGLGLASAVGGVVKGLQGTPDQVQTTKRDITPASGTELALQQQALQNYYAQSGLANNYQQGLSQAQGLQQQAYQNATNQLNGSAYQLTPQEQQQILQARNATVQAGMTDIDNAANSRYASLANSAGVRGLQGQAYGQLQANSIGQATAAQTALENSANQTAAQQALSLPYQRVASQQSLVNNGLSYADTLRNQAQANLQAVANPALMAQMQQERIAGATQTTTNPGQQGSWTDALLGGLSGATSGIQSGLNLANAYGTYTGGGTNQLGNFASSLSNTSGNYAGGDTSGGFQNYLRSYV